MTITIGLTKEEFESMAKGQLTTLSEPLKDITFHACIKGGGGYAELKCEAMQVAIDPLKGKSLFLNVRMHP